MIHKKSSHYNAMGPASWNLTINSLLIYELQSWNCFCFNLQSNFWFTTFTKELVFKFWPNWRNYGSVSYSFSCTPTVQIVTILKPKNCFVAGSPAICDRTILAGWYRFDSPAGNLIPTECPGENYCGTRKPVWLNGRHCSLFFPYILHTQAGPNTLRNILWKRLKIRK